MHYHNFFKHALMSSTLVVEQNAMISDGVILLYFNIYAISYVCRMSAVFVFLRVNQSLMFTSYAIRVDGGMAMVLHLKITFYSWSKPPRLHQCISPR